MTGYRRKSAADLVYDANKVRIRTEARVLLNEVINDAIDAMTIEFNEALNRGEVLSIGGTREEMLVFVRTAARKAR